MDGPSDDIRVTIGRSFEAIENEGQVEAVLGDIQGLIEADIQRAFDGDPEETLAAIEAWASMASNVVSRFYAPASPWPRDLAGWSKGAVERLRKIANTLGDALRAVAQSLGATSFSIAVNFPWGISIGLSW